MENNTYNISVFTENSVGMLNRITIIFTRRNINIESITASESEIEGIHRYTIVVNELKEVVRKVVSQIEKQIQSQFLPERTMQRRRQSHRFRQRNPIGNERYDPP